MHVGILGGTGPAGSAMAARLASVGYDVTIGSRSPERAQEACETLLARWPDRSLGLAGGGNEEASCADIVIVATPWLAAASTVEPLANQLADKVVISMANALEKSGGELQALLLARGSVAATVQAILPRSRVAAAFHHVPAKELGDLDKPVDCDVLICSDHAPATAAAAEMAAKIPGLRALDAGGLANAGPIESFVAVLIGLNIRYKTRVAVRFTGLRS